MFGEFNRQSFRVPYIIHLNIALGVEKAMFQMVATCIL